MDPGLSAFLDCDYARVVKVAELETILLPQDLASRGELYCLSCRRRLAAVTLEDRFDDEGDPEVCLAISRVSHDLRDYQRGRTSVSLTCGCSIRSTYYLL